MKNCGFPSFFVCFPGRVPPLNCLIIRAHPIAGAVQVFHKMISTTQRWRWKSPISSTELPSGHQFRGWKIHHLYRITPFKSSIEKGFSKKPRSITRGYRDEKIMFPFQMTMDWLGYTPWTDTPQIPTHDFLCTICCGGGNFPGSLASLL